MGLIVLIGFVCVLAGNFLIVGNPVAGIGFYIVAILCSGFVLVSALFARKR